MQLKKSLPEILSKLSISALNPMQEKALDTISSEAETILLSPTGSGKTLAFLLPIIQMIDPNKKEVQALILAPSRELAIQIEQVAKSIGSGLKCNVFYGGRNFSKDKSELSTPPHLLVGTPGRIADHFRRESFSLDHIKFLILDEFDKSLEIGFEDDMIEIIDELDHLEKKVLTSATQNISIPAFVGVRQAITLDFLKDKTDQLRILRVVSPEKDKLNTLVDLLRHLSGQTGIVFCNFKDSINRVSDHLKDANIHHGVFYGGMEQRDRERALIKFRNGSTSILLATDLAARGIDVDSLDFIIHYHLPIHESEFTHRNGRTARMHSSGTAYVIHWKGDTLPDFIEGYEEAILTEENEVKRPKWTTLFISGGRTSKISKGDIAGLFMKQGGLSKDEVGLIELKPDCAFLAVPKSKSKKLTNSLNNSKLKKKKVRIYEI